MSKWRRTSWQQVIVAQTNFLEYECKRLCADGGYRLFVIMDNLSANKTPAIRRWAKRENVELCFTPVNASWANLIEAQFGPVRTFVMGASDHPSHTVLARKLQAYLRWRKANAWLLPRSILGGKGAS